MVEKEKKRGTKATKPPFLSDAPFFFFLSTRDGEDEADGEKVDRWQGEWSARTPARARAPLRLPLTPFFFFRSLNPQPPPSLSSPPGPKEAARDQGRQKVRPCHRRRQEAPQVQARNRRPEGDQEVPEVHRAPHQEASIPEARQGDRPGLQVRPQVPVLRRPGPPGGLRGLPCWTLRGHQPVRHPRQACHHHAP